jgi:hypothetical protein
MITQADAWKSLHRGAMEPSILKLLAQLSPDSSMNSLTVAFSMSTTGRIKGVAGFDFFWAGNLSKCTLASSDTTEMIDTLGCCR